MSTDDIPLVVIDLSPNSSFIDFYELPPRSVRTEVRAKEKVNFQIFYYTGKQNVFLFLMNVLDVGYLKGIFQRGEHIA